MHDCHWFYLLYTKDHKNSNKVKALSWETGYEVTRVISWRESVVTGCQDGGQTVCRSCCATCHYCDLWKWRRKTSSALVLFMGIGRESDKMFDLIFPFREGFRIVQPSKHADRKIPVHELLLLSPTRREERLHKRGSAEASKDIFLADHV